MPGELLKVIDKDQKKIARKLQLTGGVLVLGWLSLLIYRGIYGVEGYVVRGRCGPWDTQIKAEYIFANAWIWFDYLLIPIMLVIAFGKTKAPRRVFLLMFALFITFCGTGHVLENVLAFYWPNYPMFTTWHWGTATISFITALQMPRAIEEWVDERVDDKIKELMNMLGKIQQVAGEAALK